MKTGWLMRGVFAGLLVAIWALVAIGKATVGAQTKSAKDGVYTQAQADRGAKMYSQYCVNCHKPDELVNERMKPWMGQPAQALFSAIRLTMPEDNPASLTRQQYADILAHIFRLSGFKPGSEELKGTDELLKTIVIDGR